MMRDVTAGAALPVELGFKCFGLGGVVSTTLPELVPRLTALLPPGHSSDPPAPEDPRFALTAKDGNYTIDAEGPVATTPDLDVALDILDATIRAHVALNAPSHIFVHAAVVASEGRALVVPGPSFSGKTTLAMRLIGIGASYYSDEFAVLDHDGLVHPYPKPLSIRTAGSTPGTDRDLQDLGATGGLEPIPIGLIAITQYVPHAAWRPQQRTPGEGGLALLANTVPARARSAEALEAVAKATRGVVVLEGKRGEADRVAPALLAAAASTLPAAAASPS